MAAGRFAVAATMAAGKSNGRYIKGATLGEGTFGVVTKATDSQVRHEKSKLERFGSVGCLEPLFSAIL